MTIFKAIIRFAGIFILFTFIFSCKQNESEKSDKEIKKETKDELAHLNNEIIATPGNADLYFRRAKIFFEKNVLKQAFDDATKAVSIDTSKFDYYMLLAEIDFKGLQIQRTIDAFKKAISLNPKSREAHLKLSELYLYIKAYPLCLSEANEAITIDKNIAKAYFIKGFAYKETGDTSKAISSFQTCVDIQSDYYDAYIQLGNILSAKRNKIALQYYNNALRLQPNSTEALYDRGLLYQNMGQTDLALSDYKAILKIDGNYSSAYYNIGYINILKEDFKEAIKYFTDAIRVNGEYAEAFYNRGVCYEMLGDNKSAQNDFKSALKIMPTYKPARDKLKR